MSAARRPKFWKVVCPGFSFNGARRNVKEEAVRLSEREQLADLHATPTPCPSVALDYDNVTGRSDYPTRCVLHDGHAEHHTDGCLIWSDWTAADEALARSGAHFLVRPAANPPPVPSSYRGLKYAPRG